MASSSLTTRIVRLHDLTGVRVVAGDRWLVTVRVSRNPGYLFVVSHVTSRKGSRSEWFWLPDDLCAHFHTTADWAPVLDWLIENEASPDRQAWLQEVVSWLVAAT